MQEFMASRGLCSQTGLWGSPLALPGLQCLCFPLHSPQLTLCLPLAFPISPVSPCALQWGEKCEVL